MANVVGDVLDVIDDTSNSLVQNVYGALTGEVFSLLVGLMTLSIIIFGIAILMGWIEYPVREFGKKSFKWIFCLSIIFNWDYFNLIFYTSFTVYPDEIGGLILGEFDTTDVAIGSAADISTLFGSLLERGIIASGAAMSADGWFFPYIVGAFIFLGVMAIVGFALALIILSKIALTMILSIAPLFFIFLMFEGTKQMFSSWLQQLFNFAFIAILTYVVMGFFGELLSKAITVAELEPALLSNTVPIVIVGIAGVFVLAQVTTIASGLAGGAQVGTMGAIGALNRTIQRSRGQGFMPGKGRALMANIGNRFNRSNSIGRK